MAKKIFISSTYTDLKIYRDKVIESLEKLDHQVISMERYVSEDKIPLQKCLEDVGNSDIYVGIFGWKYGFIPNEENENKLSITELEFLHAQALKIPCLIFLIADNIAVLPENMDTFSGKGDNGGKIKTFRKKLTDAKITSFFTSPEDLSLAVITALQFSFTQEWKGTVIKAEEFAKMLSNPITNSEVVNITEIITRLIGGNKNIKVLEIDLRDGSYWWSSRLFLLSALIVDYTSVGCFAFISNDAFVGLATPISVLKNMAFEYPKIAKAYYDTLIEDDPNIDEVKKIAQRVENFRENLQTENSEIGSNIKVSERMLQKWLGFALKPETIEIDNSKINFENANKILGIKFKYVPMISKDKTMSIIDKDELANNIATGILNLR